MTNQLTPNLQKYIHILYFLEQIICRFYAQRNKLTGEWCPQDPSERDINRRRKESYRTSLSDNKSNSAKYHSGSVTGKRKRKEQRKKIERSVKFLLWSLLRLILFGSKATFEKVKPKRTAYFFFSAFKNRGKIKKTFFQRCLPPSSPARNHKNEVSL